MSKEFIAQKLASFIDFLWVLRTYLRGKVFRQKTYIPQGADDVLLMRAASGANANRVLMLMRWWGLRPLSIDEVAMMMVPTVIHDPAGQPFATTIQWRDGKWDWCSSNSFTMIRK